MRIDEGQTQAVVDAAIDAGVNFFDTADVYGATQSEVFLGKAIGKRRHDVVVATKFAMKAGPAEHNQGGSRRWIMQACEASLRRLGTDYIDLYQMHRYDAETPLDETLRALDDLVSQGKVRYVGNSNYAGYQIADAAWTAKVRGYVPFVSAQNEFSLLQRRVEHEVLPACDRFGLGFLPFFPLGSGLLTGKYRRGEAPPEGTRLAAWGPRGAQALNDRNFEKIERLEGWARDRNHTILDLAFAWLLGHAEVSSVIAGATSPEQIRSNAATAEWSLSEAEVKEVGELIA